MTTYSEIAAHNFVDQRLERIFKEINISESLKAKQEKIIDENIIKVEESLRIFKICFYIGYTTHSGTGEKIIWNPKYDRLFIGYTDEQPHLLISMPYIIKERIYCTGKLADFLENIKKNYA